MPFPVRPAMCAQFIALLLASACAAPAPRVGDSAASRSAPVDDTTRLTQLEREARALIRTDGCDAASSCRTAPVGWRGCGGPRAYLVYCAATTDTVSLLRKLDELKRAEMDYNERAGAISTCEMRMPPNLTVRGGSCSEAR